jgi:hypothetical protein
LTVYGFVERVETSAVPVVHLIKVWLAEKLEESEAR